MIVKMKKVSVLLLDRFRAQSLRELRGLGTMHIQEHAGGGEELSRLRDQQAQLEKALLQLPLEQDVGKQAPLRKPSGAVDARSALELAGQIETCQEKLKTARERLEQLRKEEERLAAWGDYEPQDILRLREAGIEVRLYEAEEKQYARLAAEAGAYVVGRGRGLVRLAVVQAGQAGAPPPFSEVPVPERGLAQVRQAGARAAQEAQARQEELLQLARQRAVLQAGLTEMARHVEFESVRSGMSLEGPVAYLTGFIPVTKVEGLKKAAAASGWGLAIEDPLAEDAVPTLVENPRWVRIIQPVFDILGTVPGYREVDLSFYFLIFFSLFFAMLIGDAGYGFLLLGLTIFARRKLKRSPPEPFILLFVLSAGTIVWGAITGTWFGVEAIAKRTFLSRIVIPQIATFGEDNADFIMYICFIIGAVHLTLAHLIGFVRNLPKLIAYNDLGWLAVLWGMFFVIKWILLQQPLNPIGLWLVIGGLVVITIFGEQQGRFFKGFLMGLAKLPLKMLNSISTFSDVVSYVRLFAVGLAGIEISKAFNSLAAGIGFGLPNGIFAVLILLFGHSLNLLLGAMSVIVHGVRLNMLEFSGHIGMEWAGFSYKPFKDSDSKGDRE
jgi:V/A-type H+-transporting ATPase subunit I